MKKETYDPERAAILARGMEPSGEAVAVLLVFWRDVSRAWQVSQFAAMPEESARAATEFAKLHETQVVASYCPIPRFVIFGW